MRRILVTGGGSGIGRAIARDFADAGDQVTIAGRRAEALSETDGGRGMICKTADITDEAQVAALFDQPFDVVIANAGAGTAAPLAKTSLEAFESTVRVNLTGTFLTFREALKGMQPGGTADRHGLDRVAQGWAEHCALCRRETRRAGAGAVIGL